ncbi:MAG: hypothetical protein ACYDA8_21610 [Deferrisomatales bacterium]
MSSRRAGLGAACRWGAVAALLALGGCGPWAPVRRIPEEYARLEPGRVAAEIGRWERAVREAPEGPDGDEAHLRLALLYSHPEHPAPEYGRALEHLEAYAAADPAGAGDPWVRRLRAVLEALRSAVVRGERRKEVVDLLWQEDQEVRRRLAALQRDSRGMGEVVEFLVEEERALQRRHQALQQRARELQRGAETLAREKRDLERTAETLARENRELKETLERLKELDLQTERLRSGEGKEPPAGPRRAP